MVYWLFKAAPDGCGLFSLYDFNLKMQSQVKYKLSSTRSV
jgi:hypothetical protein